MFPCKYCKELKREVCLECFMCGGFVHINCLKSGRTPGGLLGDVFFVFQCESCSTSGVEKLERDRMSWADVVLLTLYNLNKASSNLGINGYFHWEKHIKKFINEHWKTIYPHMKTKRKSWSQMIASTLKQNLQYFECGDSVLNYPFGLSGWYKLIRQDMLPNQGLLDRRGRERKRKKLQPELVEPEPKVLVCEGDDSDESSQDENGESFCESSSDSLKVLYSGRSNSCDNMYSRSYVKPTPILSDLLFAGDDVPDGDEDIDIEDLDKDSVVDIRSVTSDLPELSAQRAEGSSTEVKTEIKEEVESEEEQEAEVETESEAEPEAVVEKEAGESEGKERTTTYHLSPSLLDRNDNPDYLPWLSEDEDHDQQATGETNHTQFDTPEFRPMSENEELYTLNSIAQRINNQEEVSIADIRLHRKLKVRRQRRDKGLRVFDMLNSGEDGEQSTQPSQSNRVLDRFQAHGLLVSSEQEAHSFRTTLLGKAEECRCFVSPFTRRLLKPYIRRDSETTPLWLQLLSELQRKVNKDDRSWTESPRAPLDYSYLRPQHVTAVNSLARQYFWPGINLSECLQYPDFTCVALYKKLVVAFAFMVPDVSFNEAYISFIFTRPEWRRAGIASFMLYHLIQTCMGRDITLHVSARNPAILLYQKFGFKIEEFVLDFYDRYLPLDSNECKHALFLRLTR